MLKLISKKSKNEIPFKSFTFPGGEVSIKIDKFYDKEVIIHARITSSVDVMLLLLAVDALRLGDVEEIILYMPYLPYARQDRVMVEGESFSLKVFCKLINDLKFKKVYITDCHSGIGLALLDNVVPITNHNLVKQSISKILEVYKPEDLVLIAPDEGASKKMHGIQKMLLDTMQISIPLYFAEKVRDVATGNITGVTIHAELRDIQHKQAVIIDDICDGGRTFTELGRILKAWAYEAAQVHLIVTHGIFSKGFHALFENENIDYVYTTDSFHTIHQQVEMLKGDENLIRRIQVFPAFD